jgi:hypothetical protein
MSETVAALVESLEADKVLDTPKSYVIGQLVAEVVASASEPELSEAVVTVKNFQRGAEQEDASLFRKSLLSLVSGLLQGVLANRQSAGRAGSPSTISEHVLNLLTIGPQNPTDLSNAIGCSPATALQALTGLHQAGLVGLTSSSESADDQDMTYELTTKGEVRQDDRFLGQLVEDPVMPAYDFGQVLRPLTEVVAKLNTHAPAIAEILYPGLGLLTDQVHDPELRAAAVGELGPSYQSNPGVVATE